MEQANDSDLPWNDSTEKQQGQSIRGVLERLQILDDHDPFIKGAGEFRFKARVHTRINGDVHSETRLPENGRYHVSDKPGRNTVHINLLLFEGFVENDIAMEITGIEMDTFDPDNKLRPCRRVFTGLLAEWLGSIGPGADPIEPEDLGDWRLRYLHNI